MQYICDYYETDFKYRLPVVAQKVSFEKLDGSVELPDDFDLEGYVPEVYKTVLKNKLTACKLPSSFKSRRVELTFTFGKITIEYPFNYSNPNFSLFWNQIESFGAISIKAFGEKIPYAILQYAISQGSVCLQH